jgi:pimeloyl-ACP methyl ester carboxylesterase
VLLHGFGASLYSWHAVIEPISQWGRVIAYDRTAFGLTERPMRWDGENPYTTEAAVEQLRGVLDHFGIEKAVLVGNSAGGTVSMLFSLRYPERVTSLILVDPAVYAGGGSPEWIKPFLRSPQIMRLGPLFARQIATRGPELIETAWHDASRIAPDVLEMYKKPLQTENWDKALWNFTVYSQPVNLSQRLTEFGLPALVITGDDDRIVPTEQSIRLGGELPNSRLVVIADSGHVPHEETPAEFLKAIEDHFSFLKIP